MGSGAAKPRARERTHEAPSHKEAAPDSIADKASRGDQECQDAFFEELNNLAAKGDALGVKTLVAQWTKCVGKHGAKEASCAAARSGQSEALEALLDAGVKPFIGRNDPEVNPLIHAVEGRHWECVVLLVPRALKYNFSTQLLQEGMMEFVVAGDVETMQLLVDQHKIPGNAYLLCGALLAGPNEKSREMISLLLDTVKDLNEVSSLEPGEESGCRKGWQQFAPIHAACRAKQHPLQEHLVEHLLRSGAVLSEWGKELSLKTSYAKRLPLHYAAENKEMPLKLVEKLAQAYPEALFAHVNDRAGRDVPSQCAKKHSEELQQSLEKLMYEHICSSYDELKDADGEFLRLIRMALLFERVRTLEQSQLGGRKASEVVEALLPKKLEALRSGAARDFAEEARRFAEANPRVNLGREEAGKIKVKSMADIGSVLRSDFWELLKLLEVCADVPNLGEILRQELDARISWVAGVCSGEKKIRSDAARYGMFIVAGLISEVLAGKASGDADSGAAVLAGLAAGVSREHLRAVAEAYSQELCIPSGWNLLELLENGLKGEGIEQIVFSGGDLVIKQLVPKESPCFEWIQGLFENTFLKRYTRDRKKGKVPEALELQAVERVLNCGSWLEYATKRKAVSSNLSEKGPAWTGELRTDVCTKGTAEKWFVSEEFPSGVNEHWLYHGTSMAGEEGITEGDFRLNLAGSNAGTLYGNGVYLAEAVSKSDEYTTPHGETELRTILLCLSCLGRVNYNDEKRPDGDELQASCVSGGFHSILGDREKIRGTYREIIVFNEDLVYPGYICRYSRVK